MKRVVSYLKEHTKDGIDADYFILLLKRMVAADCRDIIMTGNLAISCYDVDDDSDERSHNHMYLIPLVDQFFEETIQFSPKDMLSVINEMIKTAETERKANKIKPSRKTIGFEYFPDKRILRLSYSFMDVPLSPYVQDFQIEEPTDTYLRRCEDSVSKILNGYMTEGILIEEDSSILYEILDTSPRVLYRNVEIDNENVTYPYIKSYLYGLKKHDMLFTHICQMDLGKYTGNSDITITDGVYACNLIACNSGIVEIHSSYITNF